MGARRRFLFLCPLFSSECIASSFSYSFFLLPQDHSYTRGTHGREGYEKGKDASLGLLTIYHLPLFKGFALVPGGLSCKKSTLFCGGLCWRASGLVLVVYVLRMSNVFQVMGIQLLYRGFQGNGKRPIGTPSYMTLRETTMSMAPRCIKEVA